MLLVHTICVDYNEHLEIYIAILIRSPQASRRQEASSEGRLTEQTGKGVKAGATAIQTSSLCNHQPFQALDAVRGYLSSSTNILFLFIH